MARSIFEKTFDYANPFYYMGGPSISNLKGSGGVYSNLSGRPQARAARDAAAIQKEGNDKGLALIEKMYNQGREDQAPWLESSRKNLGLMDSLMGQGYFNPQDFNFDEPPPKHQDFQFNEKMSPFSFKPMQMGDMQQDPSYKWRLSQGVDAMDRSAARNGSLRSGGMSADLIKLGQNMGSQEYQNIWDRNQQGNQQRYNQEAGTYGINADEMMNRFNRGSNMFNTNYNNRQNEFQNRYSRAQNIFDTNRTGRNNYFNQLSSLSGREGADAAASGANTFGQNSANMIGQGANAQSSGLVGQQNAKTAAFQNLLNTLMQGGGMALGAAL